MQTEGGAISTLMMSREADGCRLYKSDWFLIAVLLYTCFYARIRLMTFT